MNNINLRILEKLYARPDLSIGGLEDVIGPGPRTRQAIAKLIDDGYLLNDHRLELSDKGFRRIDSSSPRNRLRRLGSTVVIPLAVVVAGSAIWYLILQSFT